MELGAIITKLALPLGLAFIMFSMGLTLKLDDFRRVIRQPLALFVGLFVQMIFLPLAAILLLMSFPIAPALAMGIMILAASPGGITSNLLTHLAKGDTALSVTMTAISSLAGIITIPLLVGFSLNWFYPLPHPTDLSVIKIIVGVFMVSTLPVLIGLLINQRHRALATRIVTLSGPASTGIFILIVISAFASSWKIMMDNIAMIGPIILVLNGLIMIVGWLLARGTHLERPQAVAISLEGGLQNGALGIFVSITLLNSQTLMIPSITYALIMNLSAALFILWQLFNKSHQPTLSST